MISVADAIENYFDFAVALDDAYWEASTIQHKDFIYDMQVILQREIGELNKLSIQDHHYPYEPITEEIKSFHVRLNQLKKRIEELIPRQQTSFRLQTMTDLLLKFPLNQ